MYGWQCNNTKAPATEDHLPETERTGEVCLIGFRYIYSFFEQDILYLYDTYTYLLHILTEPGSTLTNSNRERELFCQDNSSYGKISLP